MATISMSIPGTPRGCAVLHQVLQTRPEVIGNIYKTHYGHVLQVCKRFFRHREDAEDAASEVFLKLHRVLDKKDMALPFRPWVSRVAGRHCIDKLRHGKCEKTLCVDGADVSGVPDHSTPSPLSELLQDEQWRQVRKQLIRLPEHYRVPLVLHYYKHMSYSEIACTLNRRLPAIKTLIFRAKCQLRRTLLQPGRLAPHHFTGNRGERGVSGVESR